METTADEAGGVRSAFSALPAPRTGLEPLTGREGLRKPGFLGTELHEFNHEARRLFPAFARAASMNRRGAKSKFSHNNNENHQYKNEHKTPNHQAHDDV